MIRVLLRRAALYTRQLLLPPIPKKSSFPSSYSQKSIIPGQPDESFLSIIPKSDRIYSISSEGDETGYEHRHDLRLKMLQDSEGEEDGDSGSSGSPNQFDWLQGECDSGSGSGSSDSEFDWLEDIFNEKISSHVSPDSPSEAELVQEESEVVHEDSATIGEQISNVEDANNNNWKDIFYENSSSHMSHNSPCGAELVYEEPVDDYNDSNWKDIFCQYGQPPSESYETKDSAGGCRVSRHVWKA